MASMPSTSRGEIVGEPVVYVAVGKDLKESKFTLLWALENSEGKMICIIHVHKPTKTILGPYGEVRPSLVTEQEVRAYRNKERQNMDEILDKYLFICRQKGVRTEKLYIETNCIEKGIVELISLYGIRELVMGAAADKHYKKNMTKLKSKKAIYVLKQAPASGRIQFICNKQIIYTREGSLDGADVEVTYSKLEAIPNTEAGRSNHSKSPSAPRGANKHVKLTNPFQDLIRGLWYRNSKKRGGRVTDFSSQDGAEGPSTTESSLDAGECDAIVGLSRSTSHGSDYSTCSSSDLIDEALQFVGTEGSKNGSELYALSHSEEALHHSSSSNVLPQMEETAEMYKQNAINKLVEMVHGDISGLKKTREAEMEVLANTHAVLRQRAEQINKELKETQDNELQMVLVNSYVLGAWLRENKRNMCDSGNLDVEYAFECVDTLSKQMLECTASDLAIEDVIYLLDRAVEEGAIPFDQYLKNVRSLSREQFFNQALAEKVRAALIGTQVASMAVKASRYVT